MNNIDELMETVGIDRTIFLEDLDQILAQDGKYLPRYTQEQRDAVMAHIEKYFSDGRGFLIEDDCNKLMNVDFFVSEPTENRDFYTIVTVGMGAMLMNVPRMYATMIPSRTELMICLPKEWKLKSRSRRWNWPLKYMENIARIPIIEDSWFALGHIIPVHQNLADNTKQSGFLLLEPQENVPESFKTELGDGTEVSFLQMIPLYEEEMDYESQFGFDALLDRMADVSHIVDPGRLNSCEDFNGLIQ